MRIYYYDPNDDINDSELVFFLLLILSTWWGLIHFLDWLTFDSITWWIEPFTIVLLYPLLILFSKYGTNPLHWWPLILGTKISLSEEFFYRVDWDIDDFIEKNGGLKNVFVSDEFIKFRKKRDAVRFCLLYP